VQIDKGLFDIGIDPGFVPVGHRSGAKTDDIFKGSVSGDGKSVLTNDFGKRA
jgi:hypothetical protein